MLKIILKTIELIALTWVFINLVKILIEAKLEEKKRLEHLEATRAALESELKQRQLAKKMIDRNRMSYFPSFAFGEFIYALIGNNIYRSKTGSLEDAVLVHDFSKPRDLTPCFYCKRYDDKVERINSDGLKGHYHPHCASRVVREAMAELSRRMG